MPARFWKWRMHGGAISLARRADELAPADVIIASDMLDLAAFLGLVRRRLPGLPAVVAYFHENQAAYPELEQAVDWTPSRRRRAAKDEHYAFVNLTTALAADAVWWNSGFNRDSFLAGAEGLLKSMPDQRPLEVLELVRATSRVMPPGLDLASLATGALGADRPPYILWNHRWEHDKDPDSFLQAVDSLAARGVDFQLVVLGESFATTPTAFETLLTRHGSRVLHAGFVPSRETYAAWLNSAAVVVSTALQENFGTAVWEAVACGCIPVLPRRLAYPEYFPRAYHDAIFYDDPGGLVDLLERHLIQPEPGLRLGLAQAARALDWQSIAPRYDLALAALVGGSDCIGPRQ